MPAGIAMNWQHDDGRVDETGNVRRRQTSDTDRRASRPHALALFGLSRTLAVSTASLARLESAKLIAIALQQRIIEPDDASETTPLTVTDSGRPSVRSVAGTLSQFIALPCGAPASPSVCRSAPAGRQIKRHTVQQLRARPSQRLTDRLVAVASPTSRPLAAQNDSTHGTLSFFLQVKQTA